MEETTTHQIRFCGRSRRFWIRLLVVVFLTLPALIYLGFGRAQLIETAVTAVTPDSSGDLIVTVRLKNVSNQAVSFPGQSADFLFYEVIAPGSQRRGLVAWCGNDQMSYFTLEAGKSMNARAVVDSHFKDYPVRVGFFRESAPSNLTQTANAVTNQVPFGQNFRVWINQWSEQRNMVYSPRFVPGEYTP